MLSSKCTIHCLSKPKQDLRFFREQFIGIYLNLFLVAWISVGNGDLLSRQQCCRKDQLRSQFNGISEREDLLFNLNC